MTDGPERSKPLEGELQSLERTVEKLRILEEENAHTLKLIAEGHGATHDSHGKRLDSHSQKLDSHSQKLDQILQALAPLEQIRDFVERVSNEHEKRITALEKHTSIPH